MEKSIFQNIFEKFMVWNKSPNCIGVVDSDFFKHIEKNSKQNKVVFTRVRLLGTHYIIYPTSISNTKVIHLDFVENST